MLQPTRVFVCPDCDWRLSAHTAEETLTCLECGSDMHPLAPEPHEFREDDDLGRSFYETRRMMQQRPGW